MNKYDLTVVMEIPPCNDLWYIEVTVESDAPLSVLMPCIAHYYEKKYPECKLVSVEYRG